MAVNQINSANVGTLLAQGVKMCDSVIDEAFICTKPRNWHQLLYPVVPEADEQLRQTEDLVPSLNR